jgi:hypothetical protein
MPCARLPSLSAKRTISPGSDPRLTFQDLA